MANEERLILDASVVVKWFHEEIGTEAAIVLQNDLNQGRIQVDVPDLLFYEVTSALVLGSAKQRDDVAKALGVLSETGWNVVHVNPALLEFAAVVAGDYTKLSLYDAVYVALALSRNATLITADQRLQRIIKAPFVRGLN